MNICLWSVKEGRTGELHFDGILGSGLDKATATALLVDLAESHLFYPLNCTNKINITMLHKTKRTMKRTLLMTHKVARNKQMRMAM